MTTLIEGKDGKLYSDEFLAEIRELNQTLFKTVRATLEKTPFADCRQTLKDYVRLYEETEVRYNFKSSAGQTNGSKRLHDSNDNNGSAKSVKFFNGNAAVVIEEEEEEEKKPKQMTFSDKFFKAEPADGAHGAGSLHRSTGTSSLIAPLPLAMHFKPPAENNPDTKPAALPLINPIFPPLVNANKEQSASGQNNGSSEAPAQPKFSFSFPTSQTSQTTPASSAAAPSKPGFTFSFGSGPFSSSATPAAASTNEEGNEEGADDDDESPPPVPEAVEVKEEGSIYSKPIQLFFRPLGEKNMHEKGAGVLFLKRLDEGVQLLVRASNVLRTVLLNIMLKDNLPLKLHGKQSVRLVTLPNPAVSSDKDKPSLVEFFFKCDTAAEAQELADRLQKERQTGSK